MNPLERVLIVDDSPNILSAFKRQFRKQYDVHVAENGQTALDMVINDEPFTVIISDMQMPGMNGAELLTQVREHSPDTVRVLLTGQAELDAAISAINEGQIYRFLTKPCPMSALSCALSDCIQYAQLLRAERDLLERTLKGSVSLLVELMSMLSPIGFSHGHKIKPTVVHLASSLNLANQWEFEVAAMLCDIGSITLPPSIIDKLNAGATLSVAERKILIKSPYRGAALLQHIPKLENVSHMISSQRATVPANRNISELSEEERWPLGGQLIRLSLAFEALLSIGAPPKEAIERLQRKPTIYHPEIVKHLASSPINTTRCKISIPLKTLRIGMILEQDIMDHENQLILAKGYLITETMLMRLHTFIDNKHSIKEPIKVLV